MGRCAYPSPRASRYEWKSCIDCSSCVCLKGQSKGCVYLLSTPGKSPWPQRHPVVVASPMQPVSCSGSRTLTRTAIDQDGFVTIRSKRSRWYQTIRSQGVECPMPRDKFRLCQWQRRAKAQIVRQLIKMVLDHDHDSPPQQEVFLECGVKSCQSGEQWMEKDKKREDQVSVTSGSTDHCRPERRIRRNLPIRPTFWLIVPLAVRSHSILEHGGDDCVVNRACAACRNCPIL